MIVLSKKLKSGFKDFLRNKIQQNKIQKSLEIIQIGESLASTKYIQIKQKFGLEIGLKVNHHHFSKAFTKKDVLKILDDVKKNKTGLIFQLPVPLEYQNLVLKTPALSDVDLLGSEAYSLLQKGFLPPTIGAIDLVFKEILLKQIKNIDGFLSDSKILDLNKNQTLKDLNYLENYLDFQKFIDYKLDLSSYKIAVIGQGLLVGKPMIQYLLDRKATIFSLNKSTLNSQEITKNADIVICGAGSQDLIDDNWLKKTAIVIDASTSESNGKLKGDVNRQKIHEETILSPSPGGIGKLTVLYLFYNFLKLLE